MSRFNHPHDALPEDVQPIAGQLDELGARDRAAAAGLEDRLFNATRGVIRGERLQLVGGGHRHRRASRRVWTPMRLAAAVAVCGAGAAIWLASASWNGPGTSPQGDGRIAATAYDLDYLVLADLDDEWDPLNERLDVLRLETDAVASSVAWDLSMSGLLLTEGARR